MTLKGILQAIAQKNQTSYNGYLELIDKTKRELFNFNYPTPAESSVMDWRDYFETQFCIEFLDKEPVTEDVELFKLKLNGWLNLNMPYYKNMIESETWLNKYVKNPVENKDYMEEFTRIIEKENELTSEDETKGTAKYNKIQTGTGEVTGESEDTTKEKLETATNSTTTSDSTTEANAGTNSQTTQYPITGNDKNDGTGTPILFSDKMEEFKHPTEGARTSENTNTKLGGSTKVEQVGENKGNTKTNTKNKTNTVSDTKDEGENQNKIKTYTEQKGNGTDKETYRYHGHGNIGTQTAGEIIEHSRKAFINVTKAILKGEEIPGQNYYKHDGDKLTALFKNFYNDAEYGELPGFVWFF